MAPGLEALRALLLLALIGESSAPALVAPFPVVFPRQSQRTRRRGF